MAPERYIVRGMEENAYRRL